MGTWREIATDIKSAVDTMAATRTGRLDGFVPMARNCAIGNFEFGRQCREGVHVARSSSGSEASLAFQDWINWGWLPRTTCLRQSRSS